MEAYKLFVYYRREQVGTIFYFSDEDRFDFVFDDEWAKNGFMLSPKIKYKEEIQSKDIKNFIENLLPEGAGLETLSELSQISKSNKFSLLKVIGAETTGALTFLTGNEFIATSFREIQKDELVYRIRERKNIPITIWDRKVRLSVAGVQEKLNICIYKGKYGFGEGDLASTHILKFDKNDEQLVYNEFLSLALAKESGLKVNEASIKTFGNEEVLEVVRFDRISEKTKVKRIHIIDAVQALGLAVSHKYERNMGSTRDVQHIRDGVSYRKLFSLLDISKIPMKFKENIINWICVNLCLGNSDAHGKNISFYVDKDRLELAPFYDIVNISLYKRDYDTDMSMAISEQFILNDLTASDFIEFFEENGINKKNFLNVFNRISELIVHSLEDGSKFGFNQTKKKKEFFTKYKEDVYERISKLNIVMHYLKMPNTDKACISFFHKNQDKIKELVTDSFMEENSVEDIVFEYFCNSEPKKIMALLV